VCTSSSLSPLPWLTTKAGLGVATQQAPSHPDQVTHQPQPCVRHQLAHTHILATFHHKPIASSTSDLDKIISTPTLNTITLSLVKAIMLLLFFHAKSNKLSLAWPVTRISSLIHYPYKPHLWADDQD
jgi:hypothetical protein